MPYCDHSHNFDVKTSLCIEEGYKAQASTTQPTDTLIISQKNWSAYLINSDRMFPPFFPFLLLSLSLSLCPLPNSFGSFPLGTEGEGGEKLFDSLLKTCLSLNHKHSFSESSQISASCTEMVCGGEKCDSELWVLQQLFLLQSFL